MTANESVSAFFLLVALIDSSFRLRALISAWESFSPFVIVRVVCLRVEDALLARDGERPLISVRVDRC